MLRGNYLYDVVNILGWSSDIYIHYTSTSYANPLAIVPRERYLKPLFIANCTPSPLPPPFTSPPPHLPSFPPFIAFWSTLPVPTSCQLESSNFLPIFLSQTVIKFSHFKNKTHKVKIKTIIAMIVGCSAGKHEIIPFLFLWIWSLITALQCFISCVK